MSIFSKCFQAVSAWPQILLVSRTPSSKGSTDAFGWYYRAAFVQDDWRVNSKLILNFGVRFGYESPAFPCHLQQILKAIGNAKYECRCVIYLQFRSLPALTLAPALLIDLNVNPQMRAGVPVGERVRRTFPSTADVSISESESTV
jgi:outer membrane receptor protein involved in Fe transport